MLMDVLMDVLTDMQWIEEHKFAAWTKLDFSVCRSCVGGPEEIKNNAHYIHRISLLFAEQFTQETHFSEE
jgi:hypothetical protein